MLGLPATPSSYFLDASTVAYVDCTDTTGSAFYIGNGRYVTARHVVKGTRCKIKGKPVSVIDMGKGWLDYALIRAPAYLPNKAVISCQPFQVGANYYATGYAAGHTWVVTQRLIGTGDRDHDEGIGHNTARLRGSTTSGQSGGPVSDDDGLVRGIVSAGPVNGETNADIIQMADTPLCKH